MFVNTFLHVMGSGVVSNVLFDYVKYILKIYIYFIWEVILKIYQKSTEIYVKSNFSQKLYLNNISPPCIQRKPNSHTQIFSQIIHKKYWHMWVKLQLNACLTCADHRKFLSEIVLDTDHNSLLVYPHNHLKQYLKDSH